MQHAFSRNRKRASHALVGVQDLPFERCRIVSLLMHQLDGFVGCSNQTLTASASRISPNFEAMSGMQLPPHLASTKILFRDRIVV